MYRGQKALPIRYNKIRIYLITTWSIGCVQEVVFGSKNCNLIAFSPETSGCAGQLSTIITIFLPCISNLRSSSRNHSSKSVPSIHAFLWNQYLQGRLRTCLKHLGLADFPITNIGIFSSRTLEAAIPVNPAFLCFPPEQRLPRKYKDFDGSTS